MADTPDDAATRATLLQRLKEAGAGRDAAWLAVYDRYAPLVRAFARRLKVRAQDVEDVVQSVFQSFVSASPTFEYDPARGRFRGYLKTIAFRVVLRHREQANRHRTADGVDPDRVVPDEAAADAAWDELWKRDLLDRAVERVRARYSARPDMERTFRAFQMCVMFERPPADVAAELEMSLGSVQQAVSRVGKAVKAAIHELDERDP